MSLADEKYGYKSGVPNYCQKQLHFDIIIFTSKQVAQLSQREWAAGWVSFGQRWKTGTARQYFADIIGLSSTTMAKLATNAISYRIR